MSEENKNEIEYEKALCEIEKKKRDSGQKFCWHKFFTGIAKMVGSPSFITWLVCTCLLPWLVSIEGLDKLMVFLCWIGLSALFVLCTYVGKAIENTKISIEGKAGVNADIASIIEKLGVKEKIQGV